MNRRFFLKHCALSLGALSLGGCRIAQGPYGEGGGGDGLPNIVFILADDMGYGDVKAYNARSTIPTANLDRLATEGMRFTDAHSGSAVCTPTRYGLLTGRYCWRTSLKSGVLFPPDDTPLIGPDRLTVAGMLKRRGYHTACFGKWHLGFEWARDADGKVDFNKPVTYGPTDVGFDEFFGIAGSLDMIPYVFYHNHEPTEQATETQPKLPFPRFIREGPKAAGFEPGLVLDRLAERAVDYIERRAKSGIPFFLYLPLTAPHKPVWPAERFRGTTSLGPYGDFVHQTDAAVGRVLAALEQNGIAGSTLVVFSSDNGSYMYREPEDEPDHADDETVHGFRPSRHESNHHWLGTKADIWEGGHRVPFIVRWPGRVAAGTRCGETICLTDFMATCAQVAGCGLPHDAAEDSFGLLPLLEGRDPPAPRAPVVHHSSAGMFSLRDGRWKMVFGSGSGGRRRPQGKPFEKPYFLFDLEKDPLETTNLIEQHPDVAASMTRKLEKLMKDGRSRR